MMQAGDSVAHKGPALHEDVCVDLERFAAHYRGTALPTMPHPAVVKYAQKNGLVNLPNLYEGGRLAGLANGTRLFHLTHIAKTGGRAVSKELERIVRRVAGAEQCYTPFVHESRVNIIFFREPRAHVISQYLHGATVGRKGPPTDKGKKKWMRRQAAGYPMGLDSLANGLARWVSHFASSWTPKAGDFLSYNPLNMQSRSLTCRDEHWNCDFISSCDMPCSHQVGPNVSDANPALHAVLGTVHSAHFIGILELLPESLCVFEYRVRGSASADCARPRKVIRNPGQGSHTRLSASMLPTAVVRDVDAITNVDVQAYRAAAVRLLCDIRALEGATGRTILAPDRLLAFQQATAHVPGLWK